MASRAPLRLTAQRKPRKGGTPATPATGTLAAILASLVMSASGAVSGATAVTLGGPTSGTVGYPATFTVTANGALSSVTVTPNVTGIAGTISPASITLTSGSLSGTFTFTPAATGTASISITNNGGLANLGSPITFAAAAAGATGTWQQLTVAPHSRKVITLAGSGTNTTFDPTKALAVEAQSPVTVSGIPVRPFNLPVQGERGIIYITGGLHSNYQGNEIDRMVMPTGGATSITTTLSHQPNMPPEGWYGGYQAGGSGYIYRQYGSAMDGTNWQPYPGHQWTRNTWHPDWGFCSIAPYAINNGATVDANGLPIGSTAQPSSNPNTNPPPDVWGVVGFDWATSKYTMRLNNAGAPWPNVNLGQSGVSDWCNWRQSIVFLQNQGSGITYMQEWSVANGLQLLASTSLIGGSDRTSGNGILIRNLEHGKFLILRQEPTGLPFSQRAKLLLYSEEFGSGDARFVVLTIPAAETADVSSANIDTGISYCVDKNSRRIFWLVFPDVGVPIRIYVSTFDDITTWTPVSVTPSLVVPTSQAYGSAWLAGNRQPMLFMDGYLYLMLGTPGPNNPGYIDGSINWQRVKVDQGEELPAMNFQRFDHRLQDSSYVPNTHYFTFSNTSVAVMTTWGTKHVNWMKRSVDGAYYQCAGDMGMSFTQSMAKLAFDGTARGFTFSEILNETQPMPAGKFRPASPDDGAWFYCGATNANSALTDKFIWARGGDGASYSSNQVTRAVYAPYAEDPAAWNSGTDIGSPSAVQKMKDDGWTFDKILIFDPVTKTFAETHTETWAFDDGGMGVTHPSLMGSSATRCGAWDGATNTLWRVMSYNSVSMLAGYNFDTHTVKLRNVGAWIDTDGLVGPAGRKWFTDSQPGNDAQRQAITANGFGFFDASNSTWHTLAANSWEHKALWIDERDGKLYCVSPGTGYLWCYETRGADVTSPQLFGKSLPFYPVGERIPLVGCYPVRESLQYYPPKYWYEPGSGNNGDVAMNSFLTPFKGGLLWRSSVAHDHGVFGYPRYAFWRRLGYTGPWSVITMPQEFCANSYGVDSLSINNAEIMFISSAGNPFERPGPWPYFWKLT